MSERFERDYEKGRRDLWFAMRTRPLTDDELAQAEGMGKYLNIPMRVSYNEAQKAAELADAWALQGVLRATNAGYVGGTNNSLYEIRELGT